jgi:hypothetical protein
MVNSGSIGRCSASPDINFRAAVESKGVNTIVAEVTASVKLDTRGSSSPAARAGIRGNRCSSNGEEEDPE